MTTMSFMTRRVSTRALRVSAEVRPEKINVDNGFAGLQAIESVSLIGKHDGVMDDDLLDLLADDAA